MKRFNFCIGIMLLPIALCGENVFVYQYNAAGNCIGRHIKSDANVLSISKKGSQKNSVDVFPLETDSEFYITIDEFNNNASAKFSISSIEGTTSLTDELSEEVTIVDISRFPNGIYSLGVMYNNNLYSFKIIKK